MDRAAHDIAQRVLEWWLAISIGEGMVEAVLGLVVVVVEWGGLLGQ